MLLRRYHLLRCCHAFAWLGATLLLGAALLRCTLLLQGWQHPELSVNAFIPHTHTFAWTRRIQGAARPARWLLRSACPEGCHVDGCMGDRAGGMRCTRCSNNLLVDKVTGVCGKHVPGPRLAIRMLYQHSRFDSTEAHPAVCRASAARVSHACVYCMLSAHIAGGDHVASVLSVLQCVLLAALL